MDDQDFDEILAEVFPDGRIPEAEAAPSSESEPLSLQDAPPASESETPLVEQAKLDEPVSPQTERVLDVAETTPTTPEPNAEWLAEKAAFEARMADMETELTQRRQKEEDEARQREYQEAQRIDRERRREAQQAQWLANQLGEWDPEYRKAYIQNRSFLVQERDSAFEQAGITASALDAFVLAMQHEVPEKMEQITARTKELLNYPTYEQRVQVLSTESFARQSSSADLAARDERILELEKRLEAAQRSPAADAVDGGGSASGDKGWQDRWEAAPSFDEAFAALEESLPWSRSR